jgi:hypothetical protein
VIGLHSALLFIEIIIVLAFILSAWALTTVRRAERKAIAAD